MGGVNTDGLLTHREKAYGRTRMTLSEKWGSRSHAPVGPHGPQHHNLFLHAALVAPRAVLWLGAGPRVGIYGTICIRHCTYSLWGPN